MPKKINLYWFQHKEGNGNFGDELNPYIIKEITGLDVNFVNIEYLGLTIYDFFKRIIFSLIKGKLNIISFFRYLNYNFISKPKVLVAIGSVMQYVKAKNITVWGAGIIEKNTNFNNAIFKAVRGKYSQERIKQLNFEAPEVVGDPALLLPLIYTPLKIKKYKIGIIPHYIHFNALRNIKSEEIIVINLLDDIESIIDIINSCEMIYSTSLHGIIVSHAYNIPAVWCIDNQNKLAGDNIKFYDYFSSVGIKPYKPIDLFKLSDNVTENINLLQEIDNESLIAYSELIKKIQNDLLLSFPFELKDKYKRTNNG